MHQSSKCPWRNTTRWPSPLLHQIHWINKPFSPKNPVQEYWRCWFVFFSHTIFHNSKMLQAEAGLVTGRSSSKLQSGEVESAVSGRDARNQSGIWTIPSFWWMMWFNMTMTLMRSHVTQMNQTDVLNLDSAGNHHSHRLLLHILRILMHLVVIVLRSRIINPSPYHS